MTACNGKLLMTSGIEWQDSIESVRISLHKGDKVCKLAFHVVATYSHLYVGAQVFTMKWETNLAEHSLPFSSDYRPMLFLEESGTVMINEMTK